MLMEDYHKINIDTTFYYKDELVTVSGKYITDGGKCLKIKFKEDAHWKTWRDIHKKCSFDAPKPKAETTKKRYWLWINTWGHGDNAAEIATKQIDKRSPILASHTLCQVFLDDNHMSPNGVKIEMDRPIKIEKIFIDV